MPTDPNTFTNTFLSYGKDAGVAVAYIFIMLVFWQGLKLGSEILKDFVSRHFAHITTLETKLAENEKSSSATQQSLVQVINTLNSTMQLHNQSLVQVIDGFKTIIKDIAEIKQNTGHCLSNQKRQE